MADLTEPMKTFIVKALACFDAPTDVAKAVKEEFGVEISRQQVARYDPTKGSGKDVSKKLRVVFQATRERFMVDVSDIPIAKLAVRLRILQRSLEDAEMRGNMAMVMRVLEQAAKEMGGMYSNRREIMGRGGQPVQTETHHVQLYPTQEVAAIVASVLEAERMAAT